MTQSVQDVEMDEMATYVRHKGYCLWVWLALCRHSRQVLAYYMGDRSSTSARRLWQRLPQPVRESALIHTDRWGAYLSVVPPGRHRCQGKPTNHVERFNNTMRQRVAPLVRKTLSFAKTKQGLIQRVVVFLNHYNLTLA